MEQALKSYQSQTSFNKVQNPFQQYNDQREIVKYLRDKDEKTKVLIQQNKMQKTDRIEQMYQRSKWANKFGLIKKLEMDCIRLASLRESVFLLEKKRQCARVGPSWKQMQKPHKFIFSKRKENFRDFSIKKRQIFLHKMNIKDKNRESSRLTNFIIQEQELLQTEIKDFRDDCDTVNAWTLSLQKQINWYKQQRLGEGRTKTQKQLRISELESKIYKVKSQIKQKQAKLETLLKYKVFVEKILKYQIGDFHESKSPTKVKKSQKKSDVFLTETSGHHAEHKKHKKSHHHHHKDKDKDKKKEIEEAKRKSLIQLLKSPWVVQRIFNFSEQKCIQSINVNQVLFEDIRSIKSDFKKQREFQSGIIKDLMRKEAEEKQKLMEARKIQKIRSWELKIQTHLIQNLGEIDLVDINAKIYEMCKTFQNTKVFRYQGVPKEQTDKIRQNMRILETCVHQKIRQFKIIYDQSNPNFDIQNCELYNNLMKNIILKNRVVAFREQRLKDEEQQRLNQYKKAKKLAEFAIYKITLLQKRLLAKNSQEMHSSSS